MTARQFNILLFIAAAIRDGLPPTVREIGAAFGIRSTNGVADHLTALVRKGMITRDAIRSRGIRLTEAGAKASKGELPAPIPKPRSELEAAALALVAVAEDDGDEWVTAWLRLQQAAEGYASDPTEQGS